MNIIEAFKSGWRGSRTIIDDIMRDMKVDRITVLKEIGSTKDFEQFDELYGKTQRMDKKDSYWTEEKKQQLIGLYNSGLSFAEMEKTFGKRGDALSMEIRRLKEYGYPVTTEPAAERRRKKREKQNTSDMDNGA